MKLVDLILTVTPPGGQPTLINTGAIDLLQRGYPSGINRVTLAWSRPTGYANQTAATMTLNLVGDKKIINLLTWDARVALLAIIQGDPAPWRTLFIGWITETSRQRQDAKTFSTTVTVTNIFGRAAGTRLGDKPWPQQNIISRLTAILSLIHI